tara:strand:- start:231 stop:599 length:369 start_codon:yes stop_codon:yes gene_type:complete
MAKKVLAFFDGSVSGHGNTKYPWDSWADGNIWEVTMGVDFDCQPTSMRGILYHFAKSRGLKVQVRSIARLGKMRFRFYNPLIEAEETAPVVDTVKQEDFQTITPDVTNTTSSGFKCFGDGLT